MYNVRNRSEAGGVPLPQLRNAVWPGALAGRGLRVQGGADVVVARVYGVVAHRSRGSGAWEARVGGVYECRRVPIQPVLTDRIAKRIGLACHVTERPRWDQELLGAVKCRDVSS